MCIKTTKGDIQDQKLLICLMDNHTHVFKCTHMCIKTTNVDIQAPKLHIFIHYRHVTLIDYAWTRVSRGVTPTPPSFCRILMGWGGCRPVCMGKIKLKGGGVDLGKRWGRGWSRLFRVAVKINLILPL